MMYLNSRVGMILRSPPSTERRSSQKWPNFFALTSDSDQPNVGFGNAPSLVARAQQLYLGWCPIPSPFPSQPRRTQAPQTRLLAYTESIPARTPPPSLEAARSRTASLLRWMLFGKGIYVPPSPMSALSIFKYVTQSATLPTAYFLSRL